jgi:hypothetical protein
MKTDDPFPIEQSVYYNKYRYEVAKRLVARLKYKDGWRFDVAADGMILVRAWLPDVQSPERSIEIGWSVAFTDSDHEEYCIQAIYRAVIDMELHETSEWFRVDGRAIFNEHDLNPEKFK